MSQRKGAAPRSAASATVSQESKEATPLTVASDSSPPSLSLATDPLPTVKVNRAHLAEIKTSIDDIVKKVCAPCVA